MEKDPVLSALARIESKQDQALEKVQQLENEVRQIHRDCRRDSAITGAVAGGLSGGVIATGIAFIKAKFGV